MLRFVLYIGVWFLAMVNGHPLMPSVHQYPALNYPPTLYRPLQTEALIVQPSNNNPYSQQVMIQNPSTNYQTLQAQPLLDQIIHIYWDKFLSNPTIRNLIDTNKVLNNYKTNLHPYNPGGVVNNYIILPPDYLKENKTISRTKKPRRIRNKSKKHLKGTINLNERKNKILNTNLAKTQINELSNTKISKQSTENSWNFNTENIKCFTPADILDNERYDPQIKNSRKFEDATQYLKCQCKEKGKRNSKSGTESESEIKTQKTKKVKNNDGKKKEKKQKQGKEKNVDNVSSTSTNKKLKRRKKVLDTCGCVNDALANCAAKPNDIAEISKKDVNDVLYTNLLQQDCTDLENRCTRNSKSNIARTDILKVCPDLSDGISKSMTWFMNDYFSPHALQPSDTISLGNNRYPFELSQMYQIPQYSNVNRSNGNNKKTKRKKKKKKNSSRPQSKKENANISVENCSQTFPDKGNHIHEIINELPRTSTQNPEINTQFPETTTIISETQISEINSQIRELSSEIFETNTEILATSTQAPISVQILEANTQAPEKNTFMKPDTEIGTDLVNNEEVLVENTQEHRSEQNSTETVMTKENISMDEILQYLKKLIQDNNIEDLKSLKTINNSEEVTDVKSQGKDFKKLQEFYEPRLMESVETSTCNENITENLKTEEKPENEIPNSLHFLTFNQDCDLGLEDEIHNLFDNRLIYDYYPDFKADNHAYLDYDEDINQHNIHNRYFYTTDKKIDSSEIFSSEFKGQLGDRKVINNLFENDNVNNKAEEKDKSNEIVFRIPPGLEVPDFITRKVNREKDDPTEIYYQHDKYINDFDMYNLDNFADKSNHYADYYKSADTTKTNDNKHDSLVETVYARSKVVKYGQGQEVNNPLKVDINDVSPIEGRVVTENDDKKMIVIAKSIGPDDYW